MLSSSNRPSVRPSIRGSIRTASVISLLSAVSGAIVLTHAGDASATTTAPAPGPVSASAALVRSNAADRSSRSQARTALAPPSGQIPSAQQMAMMQQARHDGYDPHRASYLVVKAQREAHAKAVAIEAARAKAARERAERAAELKRATSNAVGDPKAAARALLASRGWSSQFSCLNALWNRESGWNYRAYNPSSGAYGIPQALPGSKMVSAGSDWRTNPMTQMKWGLGYIADRYGSPCGAWSHSQSTGWY